MARGEYLPDHLGSRTTRDARHPRPHGTARLSARVIGSCGTARFTAAALPLWDHLPMAQDDPEQRIADLEHQLAEAKAAADSQENRTGANAAAAPPPFTAPPQPPPPQAAAWNPQPPMMAPPTFGPPLAQPLGQAAFGPPGVGYNSIGLRVVRFLLHGLWWAGIGCVGFAVDLGIKVHRVSLDGQSARCGNVFDAIFKHNAYYGADTLRSACSDQV